MTSAGVLLSVAVMLAAPPAAPGKAAAPSVEADRQALRSDPLLLKRSPAGSARELALDLHLGMPGSAAALRQWASSPDEPAEARAAAFHLLCEEMFRRSRFGEALAACAEGDRIAGKPSTQSLQSMLRGLKDVPPPRWQAAGVTLPLTRDADGTRRVLIGKGTDVAEAVVDTGAEMSLMMQSVARRFGARTLGGATVGTSTSDTEVGLAVVDRLPVGDTILENVVVTVVPDDQLTFPDGTSLPALLGLPELLAAGRFAFLDHGAKLALGTAVPELAGTSAAPLYWDPSGIGFAAGFAMGVRPAHLDSGSKRVELFPTGLASLANSERSAMKQQDRTVTGVGGSQTEKASIIPEVTIRVGTARWRVAPMEVAAKDGPGEAARIGAPLFDRFRHVIFDAPTMRLFVTP